VDLPSKLGKLKKFSKETIKALLIVKGSKDEDKDGRLKQIVNEENNLFSNKVSDVLKSIYQSHSVTLTLEKFSNFFCDILICISTQLLSVTLDGMSNSGMILVI
jgi:hypothetical protein